MNFNFDIKYKKHVLEHKRSYILPGLIQLYFWFQATPNLAIPAPPPQPTFSLLPPPARVTVRPTYNNYANVDSGDSSDDEDEVIQKSFFFYFL